jgi:diguanylate cyclase (GGDEF)-like protein
VRVWSRAPLKSLMVPGGVLLIAGAALAYSGWLTLALPALSFLYYCALGGGMLLAWRFHSSRTFLPLLVLFLAQQGISLFMGQPALLPTGVQAVAVLVAVNFVLISLMQERGFTVASLAPVVLFLFVQALTVAVLCGAAEAKPSPALARHITATVPLPRYAVVVLVSAGILLLARFLATRKPVDSALLWSLCAFIGAVHFAGTARISMLYWTTAGCILAASIVETSYLLAYHDELTALPSRRALNDALMRLQRPYSIAVVDIDHFKRFNDTYGHDTGDQVLRLVAANLARVTGGGQAYRHGGEEFMILFAGKTTAEVVGPLEHLRRAIESSEFWLRGTDRRQVPRGPDRRNQRQRSRLGKGHAIRKLAAEKPTAALSVTVSIGVATGAKEELDPEKVIKAADKALYRAKDNGRNRLETASSLRGTRGKAAGIA